MLLAFKCFCTNPSNAVKYVLPLGLSWKWKPIFSRNRSESTVSCPTALTNSTGQKTAIWPRLKMMMQMTTVSILRVCQETRNQDVSQISSERRQWTTLHNSQLPLHLPPGQTGTHGTTCCSAAVHTKLTSTSIPVESTVLSPLISAVKQS